MSFIYSLYPEKPTVSEPVKVVVMAPRKVAEAKTVKAKTVKAEVVPEAKPVVEAKKEVVAEKKSEKEPKQKQARFIKGSEEAKKWAAEMMEKRKASREAKQSAKVIEVKE